MTDRADTADGPKQMTFCYTNYRGETSTRRVRAAWLAWGSTEYHPEPQWLLHAYDLDKDANRAFALRDIDFTSQIAQPEEDWHEDDGPVLWWKPPVAEAPWAGSPLCTDWPGYHTHWTPIPMPASFAPSPTQTERE